MCVTKSSPFGPRVVKGLSMLGGRVVSQKKPYFPLFFLSQTGKGERNERLNNTLLYSGSLFHEGDGNRSFFLISVFYNTVDNFAK